MKINYRPVDVAAPSQDEPIYQELMREMLQHLEAILGLPDLESFPKNKKVTSETV